jgi:protein phosphatase PTC7
MQRFTRRLLSLEMGFCMIPHPDKVYKGGEDGAFLDHRLAAFGVADGVGGYADSGIDPAVFARLIMSQTAQAINEDKSLRLRPEL